MELFAPLAFVVWFIVTVCCVFYIALELLFMALPKGFDVVMAFLLALIVPSISSCLVFVLLGSICKSELPLMLIPFVKPIVLLAMLLVIYGIADIMHAKNNKDKEWYFAKYLRFILSLFGI